MGNEPKVIWLEYVGRVAPVSMTAYGLSIPSSTKGGRLIYPGQPYPFEENAGRRLIENSGGNFKECAPPPEAAPKDDPTEVAEPAPQAEPELKKTTTTKTRKGG